MSVQRASSPLTQNPQAGNLRHWSAAARLAGYSSTILPPAQEALIVRLQRGLVARAAGHRPPVLLAEQVLIHVAGGHQLRLAGIAHLPEAAEMVNSKSTYADYA